MDTRTASPGDLGGPVASGLELRDAIGGTYKDIDEKLGQVLVEFPHETIDTFKTVFGTRAFQDGFERRLPTMCWQHDIRNPIGKAMSAQAMPKANEIRGQFADFDAVPDAKKAFSLIDDGIVTDFSFGFRNAKFEPAPELGRGVRRISSAYMAEFSPVTIGSIPGAKVMELREEGGLAIMELSEIIYLRDHKLVDDEGFRALILEHHPEVSDKLVVRDIQGDDEDADDPSGAAAEDMVNGKRWDATDAGTHTATGPNDEVMRVKAKKDDDGKTTGHSWKVMDSDGKELGKGDSDSDKPDAAKKACMDCVGSRADADWTVPDFVDADMIRAALTSKFPGMASVLEDAVILIADPEAAGFRAEPGGVAEGLVLNLRAATDQAVQWLEGVNEEELPEAVQQSVALTRAAQMAAMGLMEAMEIEEERADDSEDDSGDDSDSGDDEDDDSETDDSDSWSGDAADYSPAQWKSACLIDTGEGDAEDKGRYKLPVKTPAGKLSKGGVASAGKMIGHVKGAPDAAKQAAAKKLMGLHSKLGLKVPPGVLKATGNQRDAAVSRLDELEELETRRAQDLATADA